MSPFISVSTKLIFNVKKEILQILTILSMFLGQIKSIQTTRFTYSGMNSPESRQGELMHISIYSGSPSPSKIPLDFYIPGCQFKELQSVYSTTYKSSAVPTQLGGLDSSLRKPSHLL